MVGPPTVFGRPIFDESSGGLAAGAINLGGGDQPSMRTTEPGSLWIAPPQERSPCEGDCFPTGCDNVPTPSPR